MRRRLVVLGLVLALSACSSGAPADLPLPGGAPSGPSSVVTIEFSDVLDLVPQAAVKVNDVTVGSVERIWLDGWTARVNVRIAASVRLPDNATAAIRQSSLLGEKFVDLAGPAGEAPQGELSDGDVIPLARTRRSAEVEELLGALGLVLSGGGLAQLRIINAELAAALEGNEAQARDALHQLDAFVGGLEAQKEEIVQAIDALDRLAGRLAEQRDTIGAAVDTLAPGLTVLAEQRQQLTGALTALDELGDVGTRVIGESRDDTVASIEALRPILDQLVQAGDALPRAMDFMLTFPFPPNTTGAIIGDNVNLHITIDADASQILANLLAAAPPPVSGESTVPDLPVPPLPVPLPSLPVQVPTLPSLPLPSVSLPTLPVPTPSLPLPSIPLPTLPLGLAPGEEIERGEAPLGAADGVRGSLGIVLSGGLSA
jgi:phospholipid/cholesterol/gamma-HCH transport system substrate-binding protein